MIILGSIKGNSIEHACSILNSGPSAQDVRYHLRDKLRLRDIERTMNRILLKFIDCIPKHRPLDFAIDFTLIPYYGQPKRKNGKQVYRSQKKAGTTSFHAYATLYVILFHRRFTLYLMYVRRGTKTTEILKEMIAKLKETELRVNTLYLDREFYSARNIRLIKRERIPTIMPVRRSKKGTGITRILKGRKSHITSYTLSVSRKKRSWKVSFPVYVIKIYQKGRNNKHGVKYLGYVVLNKRIPLRSVVDGYDKRFGIESSYRILNMSRVRTSTRSPEMRLLFVVISLVLQNLWIYLKWEYIHTPRKGGRILKENLFRYALMLDMIMNYIKRLYGYVTSIPIIHPIKVEFFKGDPG